jgi:transcriptional regulator with XRE-family HTH domain
MIGRPDALSKTFGEVLREAREAEDQSQESLAERARLSRTFVSFIERGLRQPTLTTLLALAQGLGVRASTLVGQLERRLASVRRRKNR